MGAERGFWQAKRFESDAWRGSVESGRSSSWWYISTVSRAIRATVKRDSNTCLQSDPDGNGITSAAASISSKLRHNIPVTPCSSIAGTAPVEPAITGVPQASDSTRSYARRPGFRSDAPGDTVETPYASESDRRPAKPRKPTPSSMMSGASAFAMPAARRRDRGQAETKRAEVVGSPVAKRVTSCPYRIHSSVR